MTSQCAELEVAYYQRVRLSRAEKSIHDTYGRLSTLQGLSSYHLEIARFELADLAMILRQDSSQRVKLNSAVAGETGRNALVAEADLHKDVAHRRTLARVGDTKVPVYIRQVLHRLENSPSLAHLVVVCHVDDRHGLHECGMYSMICSALLYHSTLFTSLRNASLTSRTICIASSIGRRHWAQGIDKVTSSAISSEI
ncbi:hypothetical protein DAEQUDRAFT_309182 [Daedalea quercina L-15889]|uniref:Uncharacterized protein n=1 Tax=Daedalea quercina L-15889 TaxID=1314783 RepID=A0A165PY79_9APHY|nr:hypothetical protein DAEQUDRAFT_309182 [Daedalea quercina L-15889]